MPWEIWTLKRHAEVKKTSNGSGIWDPQFEILRIEAMRTDRSLVLACSSRKRLSSATLKHMSRKCLSSAVLKCIVHYEYMAFAKNTSVLREAMLLFVEPAWSAANNIKVVPRRVCGHDYVESMSNKQLFRLATRNRANFRLYIYIYIYT